MFDLERLPETIPVFPLTGALLLPKGHLPLNIFEPRYLDMVYYAREKNGLIGMIQPSISPFDVQEGDDQRGTAPRNRPLYSTGCVGMISELIERDDGGMSVLLTGLSRYDVIGEVLPRQQTFRQLRVRYDRFDEDCGLPLYSETFDRETLLDMAAAYLELYEVSPKWDVLEKTCDEELVNALAMVCPFDPAEKQALLEAVPLTDRVDLMQKLMGFALTSGQAGQMDKFVQ
ncbi:LON peptidase substrate-binding domain-containing protein [Paremcibacter congregatus]|jgi:Lon protease-like protein|uniref:Lon N-terminal domain-containing protein n=1 Tax=Paremcibacter congregatus TaxID=2043170 RepID=A0A2G4YSJ2_9PROT|nr:LON peptidase substrate-binding domain-containing protein [Paremcibacter congregatus]PHZ84416.1 hypothetical protein CRD36_11410 [Paremcibacter congregatus]QDE28634.1 hypothetical protein FIV45_15820 [Paremcibacter congregatus]|tara:strand:+ start:825 stop:1514 length:690 start_codon:yes stop_codon:yes gene_type:complete